MNLTVETRHMDLTDALRQYAETKAPKLTKYFDNVQSIEIVLDMDSGQAVTEIVVHASPKQTLVAHHRDNDMYASIDQCLDKMAEQLRRHKEKLRDHH